MSYVKSLIPAWASIALSTTQTTNLLAGNHIQYDSIYQSGDIISLSTGSGQSLGLVTLTQGYKYYIDLYLGAQLNEGQVLVSILDHNTSESLVPSIILVDPGANTDIACRCHTQGVIDCTSSSRTVKTELVSITVGSITHWRLGSRMIFTLID